MKLKENQNKIIPLTRDFMFSAVFNNEENISILEEFLSEYLEMDLSDIRGHLKLLSREHLGEKKKDAKTEVDILLSQSNGDKIIIEMNANGFYENVKKRNLIYAAKTLAREYKEGDDELKNVHSVLQINFNTKTSKFGEYKLEKLINEFVLTELTNSKIKYSNLLKIDVIDMAKANDIGYNYVNKKEEIIGSWCRMISTSNIEELRKEGKKIMRDDTLNKLTKKVEELSSDDEMIELEGVLSKRELAHIAEIEEATNKGYDSGIKEGQEKERQIIKNMLSDGLSPQCIKKYVSVSLDEINNIKNNMNR